MADTLMESEASLPAPPIVERKGSKTGTKMPITGWISGIYLLVLIFVAVFAPLFVASPVVGADGFGEKCGDGSGFALYDPIDCVDPGALDVANGVEGAEIGFDHILGIDGSGRDIFSGLVIGTRTSLIIATAAVGGAMLIGGTLGILAGYFRGKVDTVCSFIFDVLLAFPALILAIALVGVLSGPDETSGVKRIAVLIFTIGVVAVPLLGRISRASTLTWSEREFVTASKALGAKNGRIIIRDILPNVLPAMSSIAFLAVGVVIVTEGSLSLLGLGVKEDSISWGKILGLGNDRLRQDPTMAFAAAIVITLAVMALNMFGDALRQKFDVRESAL